MEISYSLTETDIIALSHYRLQVNTALRRRSQMRRWLYLLGFALIAAAGYALNRDRTVLLVALTLGVLFFAFYPQYFHWLIKRSVASAYKDETARRALENRTLRASADGLLQITKGGETKVGWDEIDDLGLTSTHAFISISERTSWFVIPIHRLTSGDFDEMVSQIRTHLEQPAEQEG
jgi:hypothetical protein